MHWTQKLCSTLGISDSLNLILEAYSEPWRHYHSVSHLETMGALFFKNWEVTRDYLGLDLAILAHDFVYNPKEEGNEIRSILAINRLGNFSREIGQAAGGLGPHNPSHGPTLTYGGYGPSHIGLP